jgi:hypothetical protein
MTRYSLIRIVFGEAPSGGENTPVMKRIEVPGKARVRARGHGIASGLDNRAEMARTMSRRRLLAVGAGALLVGCTPLASGRRDPLPALLARPSRNEWPAEFLQLPAETQELYRYAVANEATLKYFPCYCGCVADGHRSNFDCYVREVLPDGRVQLDTMSFG